jgi:kinesin family protein 5
MNQGGWFKDRISVSMTNDYDDDCHDENNKEYQEPREESERRKDGNSINYHSITGGVHLIDTVNNAVVLVDRTKGLRRFEFDYVYSDQSTQEQVYQHTVMPLVADFINGYNATCIVYGQTGSGKTYSMFGPQVHEDIELAKLMLNHSNNNVHVTESLGIVPRSIKEIFDAMEYRKLNLSLQIHAQISLSYIEIYGDEICDLLRNRATCGQSRVAAQRYVLDGSSEVPVDSLDEALTWLDHGEKQKRIAATALNARSSRAHTLVILTLQQDCHMTGVTAKSRLFLVDLGGSEQIKKSQPFEDRGQADVHNEGQRVQEAIKINLGLLALKQCVEALVNNRKHVPYSDS